MADPCAVGMRERGAGNRLRLPCAVLSPPPEPLPTAPELPPRPSARLLLGMALPGAQLADSGDARPERPAESGEDRGEAPLLALK